MPSAIEITKEALFKAASKVNISVTELHVAIINDDHDAIRQAVSLTKDNLGLVIKALTDIEELQELSNPKPEVKLSAVDLKCSQCGEPSPAMYNLKRRAEESDYWVCIKHIPSDINFPVGLHGKDWEESGREPIKR